VNHFPGKTISTAPEISNWTPFAFVVDSFLVRATDNAVGHHHGTPATGQVMAPITSSRSGQPREQAISPILFAVFSMHRVPDDI
jgi:hypothetical protein